MLERALQRCADPIFRESLCEHLLAWTNAKFKHLLLEIKADFVEDFLRRKSAEMLWR
jgi:hypothetical protein